ncbi:MAG: ribosomal protein S18-alanine N-acetyltransferase [Bdellovibrionales bacterium]|nr:ribosomal protein S18-alanine N-acetyltransferase [Bdellovibrionales bacterium]
MKAVSARPAVDEDLEQILAIEAQCYPEPWTEGHFHHEMQKAFSRMMVITDDDTDSVILGYIIFWVQAEGVSLHNIAVDPKWRGMGVAKKLMHIMINEAVRDEIPKISLEVRQSNKAAITLYKAMGFKKTHERPKFYNNGETAFVMELKSSDLTAIVH